jgi:hypothetical protein
VNTLTVTLDTTANPADPNTSNPRLARRWQEEAQYLIAHLLPHTWDVRVSLDPDDFNDPDLIMASFHIPCRIDELIELAWYVVIKEEPQPAEQLTLFAA